MKQCKITVLKTMFNEDLVREYGAPDLERCPVHRPGQVFYTSYERPDGFCDEAWKAIYQYVFAISHGMEGPFYGGGWVRDTGTAVCSCNDGLRPVIFKLETVEKNG